MVFDPAIHHRRSIRLRDYDYSREGAYFVTICVQGRENLFGAIAGGEMIRNEAAMMVEAVLTNLPTRFSEVVLDEFVIMPNHLHAIIVIAPLMVASLSTSPIDPVGAPLVGARDRSGTMQAGTSPAPTFGDIIGAFKSLTTNAYIRGVNQCGWPPFPGRLWQRNYHERVIRDEEELIWVREYVRGNPGRWAEDPENTVNRQFPRQVSPS